MWVLFVPRLEKQVGIEVYATNSCGIGGVIRQGVEDFIVGEVLVDGSKAETNPSAYREVLGSSQVKKRYLLCVLAKRNWDTFSAVKVVADQLGISMGRIEIAGIKDAKAVTAQHITIEGASAEDVQKVHVKDIQVRSVGYIRNKLSSYYLLGNSFIIIISSINHLKSTVGKRIAQTIEELRSIGGVPNFFGHQRFGTTRPITHLVGKAIVKGNFRKAALLFLAKPSPHEHPDSRKAREALRETRDFKQALQSFPKQLRYERLMLRHLVERPDDYAGAFRRLPMKLQELFPQAYQSYLFNKFLSRRIASGLPLHGAEIGDYVVSMERSGLPMVAMHRMASAENLAEINKAIKDGRMRIALPLVGFKQRPSLEVQGEIENQILEEEGISLEGFKIHEIPEIGLRGELRTAITPLKDFSLEQITDDAASPSKCKAKLSFMLCRSSYATIVLREIMKPRDLIKAGF
jgi:tRNA pseudouridine13 synthase